MKKIKKLASLLIAFILLFTMFAIIPVQQVMAATNVYMDGTINQFRLLYDGSGTTNVGFFHAGDEIAYCVEPRVDFIDGSRESMTLTDYTNLPGSIKNRLELIDYYTKLEGSESGGLWYAVAQFMIWDTIDPSLHYIFSTPTAMYGLMDYNAYLGYKATIDDKIANHAVRPSFHNETHDLEIGESLQLQDTNGVLSNFVFISSDPSVASVSQSGNTLTITMHKAGDVGLTARKVDANYEGVSVVFHDPVAQDVASFGVWDPIAARVSIRSLAGILEITKNNEEGQAVSGTRYTLSQNSNMSSPIGTYTTGSNGKVTIPNLDPGQYYIRETFVPAPYVLDNKITPITITSNTTTSFTQVNSRAEAQIEITKYGESGATIPGTRYNLINSSGVVVEEVVTGSDGKATTGLVPLGSYTFVETYVPAPYVLDPTPIPVTVSYSDQNTSIVLETSSQTNKMALGNLELTKRDSENGDLLEGAEYEVRSAATGELLDTMVTGADGSAKSIDLPLGKYFIKEVVAPVGFNIDETTYERDLIYTDMNTPVVSIDIDVENDPIRAPIQVVKVDADNEEQPIEGAEFGLFDTETDELIETLFTDENGFAFFGPHRYGDYYLKELSVAPEYYLNTNEYPISIREHDKLYVQYISNDQILVKLAIQKVDAEDITPIEGAVFEIHDSDDNVVEFKYLDDDYEIVTETQLRTNSQGKAFTRGYLKYGDYKLVEVQAADGYVRSAPISFTIDRNTDTVDLEVIGRATEIIVSNEKTHHQVSKLSINSGEALPGALLQLIRKPDSSIVLEWESQETPQVFKGLLVGETYIIKEISPPEGYLLSDPVEFTVEETAELVEHEYFNEMRPSLETEALFENGSKLATPTIKTVYDSLTAKDLLVGKTYLAEASLIDYDTKEIIGKGELEFVAEETEMTVLVPITFDSALTEGKTYVVFEDLYKDNRHLATHSELSDENQTVYVPKVRTMARNEDQTQEVFAFESVDLVDEVIYENLIPYREYKIETVLVAKPLVEGGETEILYESEVVFVPDTKNGSVEIPVNLDLTDLEGREIVFFEYLSTLNNEDEYVEVGVHEDINDEDQTIKIVNPEIGTTATDDTGIKEVLPIEGQKLLDEVEYTDLIPGKEYTMKGYFVIKPNEENPLEENPLEENDYEIITEIVEVKFTPETKDGKVTLEFESDLSELAGREIVAFEELFYDGVSISIHADIEDEDQTVKITNPSLGTKAELLSNISSNLKGKVVIRDTASYKDLIIGKEYEMIGVLMDKETNEPLLDKDGNEYTSSVTFVAEEADGEAVLEFEVPIDIVEGKTIVVFEDLYHEGQLLTSHADIDDEAQTVFIDESTKTAITSSRLLYGVVALIAISLAGGMVVFKKSSKRKQEDIRE